MAAPPPLRGRPIGSQSSAKHTATVAIIRAVK